MASTQSIEVVLFRLKEGVSKQDFLAYASATQDSLSHLDGFIKRQLSETAEGLWVDMVWWESYEKAMGGQESMMQVPAFMPFVESIDDKTIQVHHFTPQFSKA